VLKPRECSVEPGLIFGMMQPTADGALRAAIELDIFTAVGNGPETSPPLPAIVPHRNANPHPVDYL